MASFAHNLRRTRYFIMYCSSSRYSFPHLTFCLGVALFCFCLFFPSPLFATYRRRSIRKLCPFTSSSRCVPLLYYTCTFVSCDVSGLRMSRFSYPVRVTCGVFFLSGISRPQSWNIWDEELARARGVLDAKGWTRFHVKRTLKKCTSTS